jgi:hypothetical protein
LSRCLLPCWRTPCASATPNLAISIAGTVTPCTPLLRIMYRRPSPIHVGAQHSSFIEPPEHWAGRRPHILSGSSGSGRLHTGQGSFQRLFLGVIKGGRTANAEAITEAVPQGAHAGPEPRLAPPMVRTGRTIQCEYRTRFVRLPFARSARSRGVSFRGGLRSALRPGPPFG